MSLPRRVFWVLWAVVLTRLTAAQMPVDFSGTVRPLLAERCFACHGPDAGARQADLRLDRFQDATRPRDKGSAAIVPGKPGASHVVHRIRSRNPEERMPPPEAGEALTDAEATLLEQWIREGATYEEHWSFVAPRPAPPPAVLDASWIRDPLDGFVLARLRSQGLEPSREASREILLRRAALSLTGVPPTWEEIEAYLSDSRPDAFERVIDALLASPRFGEHMATQWLDVARYADTYGYQADRFRRVWPYRDWVVRAFNDNLPYDRFLTLQLAGDLLPTPTRDERLATAFNRLHRQTNEGGSVCEEFRVEAVADRVHTMGTAFLGLTLECARCHDHKFDPISQAEYYGLSAFFDNINEAGLYSHFTDATPTPALDLPTEAQELELWTRDRDIARAVSALETAEARATSGFRHWLSDTERSVPKQLQDEVGHFPLDGTKSTELRNAAGGAHVAKIEGAIEPVDGVVGGALRFDGEGRVTLPGVGEFDRTNPFSISLWINPARVSERAVVFHRTRAWTDAGSQGYELLLLTGRLQWSLIHFWPQQAISLRAHSELPTGSWSHVVVTYDGSEKASGLGIWIDGSHAAADVIQDGLSRGITGGGELVLTLGERFRDRGFVGGSLDEVRVFARKLVPLEIAQIHDGRSLTQALATPPEEIARKTEASLLDYYKSAIDRNARRGRHDLERAHRARAKVRDQVPSIMVMEEMPRPKTTFLLTRGAYDRRGREVKPDTPAALRPFPVDAPRTRLGLARWLTHPEHPLTARVAVNRAWQWMFGRGLLVTAEDFGIQGERPSHPELLDTLALDFVATGFDVKRLLRRIVLSATWRQSSRVSKEHREVDPENRWLSRGPTRRLTAETLRDQALFASGLLVEQRFGPPVKPYQPPGLWKELSGETYQRDAGVGSHRRSLYTYWKSTCPPPAMMLLDASKRDVCQARRQRTNTPLQWLLMWNDVQYVEAARGLAQRVFRSDRPAREWIHLAFQRLCTRHPTARELDVLVALFGDAHAHFALVPNDARSLIAIGDEPARDDVDPEVLAAATFVCSTLLGYDAAVVLR